MRVPAETGKRISLFVVMFLFLALVLSGCSSSSSSAGTNTPPPPNATVTVTLTPSSVMPGQSATLTWASGNATTCTAGGAWSGTLGISGSTTVMLQGTAAQTYSVTCSGSGLAGSRSVTLDAGNEQGSCGKAAAVRAHSGKRTPHGRKLTGIHS